MIILSITILAGWLRFVQLDKFPVQLNHDEISQLYESISIAQTGKDIYGNFLPVVFPSFGVFIPGHYIYLTTIAQLFFQQQEIAIRVPAAFFGTLLIPAVFLFVRSLTANFKLAALAATLAAITPVELFYSRKSFEYITGQFLVLLGLTWLLYSLKKRNYWWAISAATSLSLAMYTYTAHAVVVPLLVVSFIFIFRRKILASLKKYLLAAVAFLLVILPLMFLVVTNADLRSRASSIFITQDNNLGRQLEYVSELKNTAWFFYHHKTIVDFSFNRFLDQFNPNYLFLNGLDLTNQGILGLGPLLIIQFPLVILGIIHLIRKKDFSSQKKLLLALIIFTFLPSGLTFEQFSPHRSALAFSVISIVSAFGLYWLGYQLVQLGVLIIISLFILNFLYSVHLYTVNYPYEKSQHLHYPFKQVAQFAWSQKDLYDQIIFDPKFGEVAPVIGTAAHYYLAYYGNYPPASMQQQYRLGSKPREILFDKFSIRAVDFREDDTLKNTLIIASIWSLPQKVITSERVIKTFYFYDGQPAFYAISLK